MADNLAEAEKTENEGIGLAPSVETASSSRRTWKAARTRTHLFATDIYPCQDTIVAMKHVSIPRSIHRQWTAQSVEQDYRRRWYPHLRQKLSHVGRKFARPGNNHLQSWAASALVGLAVPNCNMTPGGVCSLGWEQ